MQRLKVFVAGVIVFIGLVLGTVDAQTQTNSCVGQWVDGVANASSIVSGGGSAKCINQSGVVLGTE